MLRTGRKRAYPGTDVSEKEGVACGSRVREEGWQDGEGR